MDINSWIEEIHRNKHNMIPVVKLAISKPIEALLETSNLTNDFPTSLLPVIKSKKNEADISRFAVQNWYEVKRKALRLEEEYMRR